ncbi:outer membrane autotransporter barrel domain protein [compost metagenome]
MTGSAADSSSNLGSGGVSIAAGATLAANTAGAFTFNNNLSGAGTLQASSGNQTFSFGSEAGSAFAGTAALSDNTFDLSGNNTTAMTNATLRTEAGNVTTVGDGNQNIGGLTFNGGKVVFDARVPDQQQASSMITVNALDASGPGTVAITVPQPYTPSAPSTPNATNLLAQDDAGVWTKLVNATSTTGSAGAIALVDQNGNVVSAGREVDIAQGGNVVTKGTYDYRLTTAPNDGLYVNYGLKQLDLQSGQTLTLAEDTGATGAAADMSAKITGTGNLAVNAGAGAVSLSNATNDYEGETTVASGTLRLDANHALGSTTVLHIAHGAATDVNGKTQTIQQLDGQAGSALNINGGTLTIANGGTSAGSLTGAGTLNLAGGVLDVQGANAGLSASTSIAAGAIAKLNDAQGLGTGAIVDDGKLVLNTATDWTLANAVSGTGDLVKQGAGTLTAGDALTYTGKTAVDAGTLILGDATQPNVILGGIGAGTVSVAQGATLAGLGTVSGQVVNAGTVAALNALPGHEGDAAGTFTLAGGMVNSGTVNLAGASVGNQLVVKGDYVGNNGQVVLSTVKGDDNSATDKLVLDGGRASGNTDLVIKHAGGNGAQTTQGIRVVETRNGATTDATAFALSQASDGYRAGVGTIAAGPYDYSLARGGNGGVANDWYLSSVGTTCETNGKVCPPAPIPGPTPDTPVTPTQDDGTLTSSYRPEVGAYLNNRLFAQTMQFHTLHERQSQAPGMVGKDLNASSDANAWVRVMGKTGSREGALSATDTSYLVHAGGDILRFRVGDEGSLRLGAMGAYGSSHNRADNGSLSARGTVDGYNAGVYGTWYGNKDILSGPYVDSWVMYGRFNNQVNGQGLPSESYKSSNLAASLEAGYSFPIYESGKTRMFIEPQGQVIVSDYRADTHTERNGTVVSGQSGTSTTTRLGVRLHGDVKDETGVKQMRPFAEVNWWHGPGSQTASFDGVVVRDDLPADRIEGKIGLQGNVTKAVSVWGSVGFEAGARDYTAGKAQVGVKYSW